MRDNIGRLFLDPKPCRSKACLLKLDELPTVGQSLLICFKTLSPTKKSVSVEILEKVCYGVFVALFVHEIAHSVACIGNEQQPLF